MKYLPKIFILFAFVAWLAGCAPVMQPPLAPLGASSRTAGGQYLPKINNFQVLLDASLSMDEGGKNDFLTARNLVSRINQEIPSDLQYNAGLRSIGHNSYQSKSPTDLLYGMTSYQRAGFHEALGKIKYVGGTSPMAAALQAAGNDLKSASGKSSLILVTDGLDMDDAPDAAKNIKAMLGDNLCIYTIAIGKERNGAGQKLLKKVAAAGQCGSATTDADLADAAAMTAFVDSVFIGGKKPAPKPAPIPVAPAAPVDSDGDGVTDDRDKCPNTPKGAPVDSVGCPLDSDGDGVYDYLDTCPNTPKGVSIDDRGCPTSLTLKINFGHDSNVVGDEYMGELAKAAKCINEYPGNQVFIEGHTDSQGPSKYNQGLSERRASAVVKALVSNYDIPASRLTARGFGEDSPIADNKTSEGKKENRRVEVLCGAMK